MCKSGPERSTAVYALNVPLSMAGKSSKGRVKLNARGAAGGAGIDGDWLKGSGRADRSSRTRCCSEGSRSPGFRKSRPGQMIPDGLDSVEEDSAGTVTVTTRCSSAT